MRKTRRRPPAQGRGAGDREGRARRRTRARSTSPAPREHPVRTTSTWFTVAWGASKGPPNPTVLVLVRREHAHGVGGVEDHGGAGPAAEGVDGTRGDGVAAGFHILRAQLVDGFRIGPRVQGRRP